MYAAAAAEKLRAAAVAAAVVGAAVAIAAVGAVVAAAKERLRSSRLSSIVGLPFLSVRLPMAATSRALAVPLLRLSRSSLLRTSRSRLYGRA